MGKTCYDDTKLFEMLLLESFQAEDYPGLRFLKKRENFRKAFDNFDACKIVCIKKIKSSP